MKRLFALVLFLATSPAWAGADVNAIFIDTVKQIVDNSAGWTTLFVKAGWALLAGFIFCQAAWFCLMSVLEDGGVMGFVHRLVGKSFLWGVAILLVGSYGVGGSEFSVPHFLIKLKDWLLDSLSLGAEPLWAGLDGLFGVATTIYDSMLASIQKATGVTGLLDIFSNAFTISTGMALSAVSLLMLLIAGMVIAGIYVVSQIELGAALMLGPLLIPFMLFSRTQGMFQGWIEFCLKAVLTAFLAPAIIQMMMPALQGMASMVGSQMVDGNVGNVFSLCSGLILLSAIVCFVCIRIPGIAHGVMSGHGGVGGMAIPLPSANIRPSMPGSRGGSSGGGGPRAGTKSGPSAPKTSRSSSASPRPQNPRPAAPSPSSRPTSTAPISPTQSQRLPPRKDY